MKGIILAGGTGSRLKPCTDVTNKHLLPVYNKPMIYHPINALIKAGIKDILIITGTEHAGTFMQLLGSGSKLGVNFTFKVQDGPSGIAQALFSAEDFAQGDNIAVILGDNIFQDDFTSAFQNFTSGAGIFVKEVKDPQRFGVAQMQGNKVIDIQEKPENPKSKYAVTGLYLYDNQVFDIIRTLKPSRRGEYEITDVNNAYLKKNQLKATPIEGEWSDAGTHESLFRAAKIARSFSKVEGAETCAEIPKVVIGLLIYHSKKYLSHCLESLLHQDYKNIEIVIQDHTNGESGDLEFIKKHYPKIKTIKTDNLGFAAGHNNIIRTTEGTFYLAANPDMLFESDFVSELVQAMARDRRLGAATGKLKRWDFENVDGPQDGKTNYIDSVGIRFLKSHRFEDIGQGEIDNGQYNEEKEVFGASGAAAMYRRSALKDTAFIRDDKTEEYFDELMYMYKEDIDLAYRFQWAGYGTIYVPTAIAFHDRTVDKKSTKRDWRTIMKNRKNRPKNIKEWSYLSHQILIEKNRNDSFSSETKQKTWSYETKSLAYILLKEPFLLSQRRELKKRMPEIEKRKAQLKKRVSAEAIEKWME